MKSARAARWERQKATGTPPGSEALPANVLLTEPNSDRAEAIRVLRTRVQSQHLQKGRRALAICAPAPDVGCTFVAVNLAVGLAQIGVKTLLIDGNLRAPAVHRYFEPKLSGPGLTDCLLASGRPLSDFTHEGVVRNLDVVPAGEVVPGTHELLANERFRDVVEMALRDYELTILDTPPANGSADALRIGSLAGFSLVVARRHSTLVSDLGVLIDQLRKERANPIGTVLNA